MSHSRVGRIRQEYACSILFDGLQRVVVVDFLGEKVALGEDDLANCGVIGLANCLAHVRRLEDRAILVEQPLVVPEVVRVDYAADPSACTHLQRSLVYLPSK